MEFVNYSPNYACQKSLHQSLATFRKGCRNPSPLAKGFHLVTLFPSDVSQKLHANQQLQKHDSLLSGVQEFSTNRGAHSKFGPEGWHASSSKLRTHKSGLTCELHRYLVLCAQCMWTSADFCMKEENCTDCTLLRAQTQHTVAGICAPLITCTLLLPVSSQNCKH